MNKPLEETHVYIKGHFARIGHYESETWIEGHWRKKRRTPAEIEKQGLLDWIEL